MSDQEHITRLKISKIIENDNGTSTLYFDLNEDFVEWFKKHEGLKRFSHKRFSKFIKESLKNNISKLNNEDFSGVIGNIITEEIK